MWFCRTRQRGEREGGEKTSVGVRESMETKKGDRSQRGSLGPEGVGGGRGTLLTMGDP